MHDDDVPVQPVAYRQILAGNLRAARARLGLTQTSLAQRMKLLGYRWHFQTVGAIERGTRPLDAEELAGLCIALDTTLTVLAAAPPDVPTLMLPSGDIIGSQRLTALDGTTGWDENRLKLVPPADAGPLIDAQLAGKREELRRLEAYVEDVRRQGGGEPQEQ